MHRIYLVNVGANTSDWSRARSPIFPDGSFEFVSFSCRDGVPYPSDMLPFTRNGKRLKTHLDPDWTNLSYGDVLTNGRGGALRAADIDDVLLFWGLLCSNEGVTWDSFNGQRGWYLLGVMRIVCIMEGGQCLRELPERYRARASTNAHLDGDYLGQGQRVFIADPARSGLLEKAVDLEATSARGLMFQAFRSRAGVPLSSKGSPRWSSSLRACRCMFDLEIAENRKRARQIHAAIRRQNALDLLSI